MDITKTIGLTTITEIIETMTRADLTTKIRITIEIVTTTKEAISIMIMITEITKQRTKITIESMKRKGRKMKEKAVILL